MSENIRKCPTCGQSVNRRQIPFYKGMVNALWNVFQWCEQNHRHEFKKREIKHLMDDVAISVFAYWRWFGGLVYNPDGVRGNYGLNMERCEEFFAGTLQIPVEIWTDPLTHEVEAKDYRTIGNIPHLSEFLDQNKNFIARYQDPQKSLF